MGRHVSGFDEIDGAESITGLFPVPDAGDRENHVYVSVGHGQMMTDAMKPLGLSVWQMTTPRPMAEAGGRLFVDVTQALSSPAGRQGLLDVMGRGDPLIRDALETVLERGDFIPSLPDESPGGPPAGAPPASDPIETDPAIVADLIARSQASIAALKRDIRTKSGTALLDFILADIQGELKRILFDPRSHQAIMAGMEASLVAQRPAGGVARREERGRHAHAVRSPQRHVADGAGAAGRRGRDPPASGGGCVPAARRGRRLPRRAAQAGGRARGSRRHPRRGSTTYGMRGVGEIDITRPRWSERPTTLVPIILGHIENFEPGAGERRFEQGRQEARKKEQELLERLRAIARRRRGRPKRPSR